MFGLYFIIATTSFVDAVFAILCLVVLEQSQILLIEELMQFYSFNPARCYSTMMSYPD